MKILDVPCTECAAPVGSRCIAQDGFVRVRFHRTRLKAAELPLDKYHTYNEELNLSLAETPQVSCPYCGALPGYPCRRSEGQVRYRPHRGRKQS